MKKLVHYSSFLFSFVLVAQEESVFQDAKAVNSGGTQRFKINGNYEYAIVKGELPNGTSGGNIIVNRWVQRAITEVESLTYKDNPDWISVGDSQFILKYPGVYKVDVKTSHHYV